MCVVVDVSGVGLFRFHLIFAGVGICVVFVCKRRMPLHVCFAFEYCFDKYTCVCMLVVDVLLVYVCLLYLICIIGYVI